MFGHQYHYIQFSLSSVLIQQYFLQILRAIEILKYSIFQISINFPFLNCVRPGQDWSVAGLNYPNSKPSFCIHNHTRPIIFLLEEINPLVNQIKCAIFLPQQGNGFNNFNSWLRDPAQCPVRMSRKYSQVMESLREKYHSQIG